MCLFSSATTATFAKRKETINIKKTFSKQHSLAGQMEPLVMVGAGTDQLEFTL